MLTQELKNLNNKIKKHANIFDWETVKKLTLERHEYLKNFFRNEDAHKSQEKILLIQSEILQNDKEVKKIIDQQKKLNIESSINLRNSFSACNSYQQTHNASAKY